MKADEIDDEKSLISFLSYCFRKLSLLKIFIQEI